MTVSSAASRNDYVAGGSSCQFAYTFKLLDATSLLVYLCDVLQSTGVYSVSGVSSVTGGTVTFATVPGAGCTVHLVRAEPYTQTVDFINHGTMDAETLEGALDKPVILAQQLLETFDRVPQLDVSSCVTDLRIDDPVVGFSLLWDATGTRITSGQAVTVGQLAVPAFTAGSIVYASATCTLAQDNTKLFWNSTSKRLAVGTSTVATAKVTVVPDTVAEHGISATVTTATGGNAVRAVSAATSNPAVSITATCSTGLYAENLIDQGTDSLNSSNVGVASHSTYGRPALFQQGESFGTLTANSRYPALDVVRAGALGGFNYTCAVLRVTDSTASTGPLVQVVAGTTERFAISANGVIQTCELRVSSCSNGAPALNGVYEQSLIKAMVFFDGTAVDPISAAFSYNIGNARITKYGTGDYCVSFQRAFASANYLFIGTSADVGAPDAFVVNVTSQAATCCRFRVRSASTAALSDRSPISIIFMGTQA